MNHAVGYIASVIFDSQYYSVIVQMQLSGVGGVEFGGQGRNSASSLTKPVSFFLSLLMLGRLRVSDSELSSLCCVTLPPSSPHHGPRLKPRVSSTTVRQDLRESGPVMKGSLTFLSLFETFVCLTRAMNIARNGTSSDQIVMRPRPRACHFPVRL